MDFDRIRGKLRQIKAPTLGSDAAGDGPLPLEGLVARLRAADEQQRGGLRKALPLYFAATICWLFVFVVMIGFDPKPRPSLDLLFWGSLAGVYVLVTAGVVHRLGRLDAIDYALSTRDFLAMAQRRYRFMGPREYAVAGVGCVALGIATGPYLVNLMTHRYFGAQHQAAIIAAYCLFYAGVCVMGFVFTYRNWKRDRRALWLAVGQMLADLDAEGQTDAGGSPAGRPQSP